MSIQKMTNAHLAPRGPISYIGRIGELLGGLLPSRLAPTNRGHHPFPVANFLMRRSGLSTLKVLILGGLVVGLRVFPSGASAADNAELVALRAKLNGVWRVDAQKTIEFWGFKNGGMPPILQGTLEGYQGNTFEFRPDFMIMNYAEGGRFISTQRVDMTPKRNKKGLLTFEPSEAVGREFVGAQFNDTHTVISIKTFGVTSLCIERVPNATIEPYGKGFELTVPSTHKDTGNEPSRSALKNRLSSALQNAKLGVIMDAQYGTAEGKGPISEDVRAKLDAIDAVLQKKNGDTDSVAPESPTKIIYLLELYDPAKNREPLGRLLLSAGCPEDSELKALDADPAKTTTVRDLLQKK